ncbi:DUF5998 family protein [Dermabacteraceae bacterium P13115]|nr:hypothetical protein [Dermabacteraceae bacterium TAE3-ERU5]
MFAIPEEIAHAINRSGYFPQTATAVLATLLAGAEVHGYLVHPETTFEGSSVRRHLTLLALTEKHLIVCHLDDEPADELNPMQVRCNSEKVLFTRIQSIGLGQTFDTDGENVDAQESEVSVGVNWSTTRRIDVEPMICDDSQCTRDHGYSGSAAPADLMVRVSALADGPQAVREALGFFANLSERVNC